MTGRVLSRRSALAGLTAGAAAVAGGSCAEDLLRGSGPRPVAAMLDDLVGSYDFNQGWLFGGPYVKGAESPGHDDSGYARVTLPHTVTDLSWAGWDYRTWERTWIYRKHFDSAFTAGSRVLVTFDGVMTNATVVLNGRVVATHAGGYLPWTAELTGHLRPRGNVLAVIVDGRWLDVPPDALPGGPPTMDFLQPAASTGTCGSRWFPASTWRTSSSCRGTCSPPAALSGSRRVSRRAPSPGAGPRPSPPPCSTATARWPPPGRRCASAGRARTPSRSPSAGLAR